MAETFETNRKIARSDMQEIARKKQFLGPKNIEPKREIEDFTKGIATLNNNKSSATTMPIDRKSPLQKTFTKNMDEKTFIGAARNVISTYNEQLITSIDKIKDDIALTKGGEELLSMMEELKVINKKILDSNIRVSEEEIDVYFSLNKEVRELATEIKNDSEISETTLAAINKLEESSNKSFEDLITVEDELKEIANKNRMSDEQFREKFRENIEKISSSPLMETGIDLIGQSLGGPFFELAKQIFGVQSGMQLMSKAISLPKDALNMFKSVPGIMKEQIEAAKKRFGFMKKILPAIAMVLSRSKKKLKEMAKGMGDTGGRGFFSGIIFTKVTDKLGGMVIAAKALTLSMFALIVPFAILAIQVLAIAGMFAATYIAGKKLNSWISDKFGLKDKVDKPADKAIIEKHGLGGFIGIKADDVIQKIKEKVGLVQPEPQVIAEQITTNSRGDTVVRREWDSGHITYHPVDSIATELPGQTKYARDVVPVMTFPQEPAEPFIRPTLQQEQTEPFIRPALQEPAEPFIRPALQQEPAEPFIRPALQQEPVEPFIRPALQQEPVEPQIAQATPEKIQRVLETNDIVSLKKELQNIANRPIQVIQQGARQRPVSPASVSSIPENPEDLGLIIINSGVM